MSTKKISISEKIGKSRRYDEAIINIHDNLLSENENAVICICGTFIFSVILLSMNCKGRVTVWPFFGPRWIWLKFEYMVV